MASVYQERFWAQIPRAVLYHSELNGNDIRVYAALSDRAGRKDNAWPSHRTLAADLHMSKTTVAASVERLVVAGAIERSTRKGGSNHYFLPFKEPGSETGTPPETAKEKINGHRANPPAITGGVPETGAPSGVGQNLGGGVPVSGEGVPETGTELEELTRRTNKSARGGPPITDTDVLDRARLKAQAKGGAEALAQHIYKQDYDLLVDELRKEGNILADLAAIDACALCDNRGWTPNADDTALDRCTHPDNGRPAEMAS